MELDNSFSLPLLLLAFARNAILSFGILCDFHFEFIHFFFDFLNHLKEKGVVFMI